MGKEKENNVGLIPFSREKVKVGDKLFRLDEFGSKVSYEKIIVDSTERADFCISCVVYDRFTSQTIYRHIYKKSFEINKRYIDRRTRIRRKLDELLEYIK